MTLTGVLVVPGLACKLFSSRHAYEHDGVRTYLNDSMYLRLPSGSRVCRSSAAAKHYIVNAVADDSGLAITELSPN